MDPVIKVDDAIIAQPPATEASRPSASFFDNNSSQVNPAVNIASQTIGSSTVSMDKSSKPFKMIFLTVSLVIVLLGSFAAFYYGYYLPNHPASVVKKAVEKLSKQNGARNFEAKSITLYDNQKAYDLTIKTSINDQGDIRSDFTQALTKNTLANSLIIKSKQKELYIKINQLEALLASYDITTKPSNQSAADSLGSNWLKIDSTSFANSNVILGTNYDNMKLCSDSFMNFVSSDANSYHNFPNNIAKFQNSYQKTSNEIVGSFNTTLFNSNYDNAAATKANQLVFQDYQNRLDAINLDCSLTTGTKLISDPSVIKTDSSKLYIDSSNDLIKVEVAVNQGSAKNTSTILFKSEVLDASIPSNVISASALTSNSQDYTWLVSVLKAIFKAYVN